MPSIMPKAITGGQLWLLVQCILPVTTTSQLVFSSVCNHNSLHGLGTAYPLLATTRCMHYIWFLCNYRQCWVLVNLINWYCGQSYAGYNMLHISHCRTRSRRLAKCLELSGMHTPGTRTFQRVTYASVLTIPGIIFMVGSVAIVP